MDWKFAFGLIQPGWDAIFSRLPFTYRWRLLFLQTFNPLLYFVSYLPWVFSKRYTVQYLPIKPGRSVRAIVFQPPRQDGITGPRPLHLDLHGGGFLGGLPEQEAMFLEQLSDQTGAVVVSAQYRYAPKHPFPAAIDDIDDVVQYLIKHAEDKLNADPRLLTLSGHSAGANLAFATCLQPSCHGSSTTAVKAVVSFYAPIDLRLRPRDKPRPTGFPTKDPIAALEPLFNAYAHLAGPEQQENPRLHPILAPIEKLPPNILMIVARIDILLHEQNAFYERLKRESGEARHHDVPRRIERIIFKDGFHGWLSLPKGTIDESSRTEAFNASVGFIRDIHRQHGWEWSRA